LVDNHQLLTLIQSQREKNVVFLRKKMKGKKERNEFLPKQELGCAMLNWI